jgi:predicted nucleotidyltransferase
MAGARARVRTVPVARRACHTEIVGWSVSDLEPGLIEVVISSCRAREPRVAGILVHGSYATGLARPESDLDLGLFIEGKASEHYRTWFEDREEREPLHVSARCDLNLQVWEAEREEPEGWALGLPVELDHVWLWCGDPKLTDALGDSPVLRKVGTLPEIEDMVDSTLKMRRHLRDGDELGVRLAAQTAARYAAPTVCALNEPEPVADPRSALAAVLALEITPPEWRADFPIAVGLTGAPVRDVVAATNRLVSGTLRLARERKPSVDRQPEIERYLCDGTLERLLLGREGDLRKLD